MAHGAETSRGCFGGWSVHKQAGGRPCMAPALAAPQPRGRRTDGGGQGAEDEAVGVLEKADPLEAIRQPLVSQACKQGLRVGKRGQGHGGREKGGGQSGQRRAGSWCSGGPALRCQAPRAALPLPARSALHGLPAAAHPWSAAACARRRGRAAWSGPEGSEKQGDRRCEPRCANAAGLQGDMCSAALARPRHSTLRAIGLTSAAASCTWKGSSASSASRASLSAAAERWHRLGRGAALFMKAVAGAAGARAQCPCNSLVLWTAQPPVQHALPCMPKQAPAHLPGMPPSLA